MSLVNIPLETVLEMADHGVDISTLPIPSKTLKTAFNVLSLEAELEHEAYIESWFGGY